MWAHSVFDHYVEVIFPQPSSEELYELLFVMLFISLSFFLPFSFCFRCGDLENTLRGKSSGSRQL